MRSCTRTIRSQVTVPANQSASSSLLEPRSPVDGGGLESEQPQGPARSRRVEGGQAAPPSHPRIDRELPPARHDRQRRQHDHQVATVVVVVGRREEQVVGDDGEDGERRRPGEEPDRHRHRTHRTGEEHGHIQRMGKVRVPGRVRLVEDVPIDDAAGRLLQEGPQVEQHDRAGQDAEDRYSAHGHPPAEQLVEPLPGRGHGALRSLCSTTWNGPSTLRQYVTVASRWSVSVSSGVLAATQSRAAARKASWLSMPASAWCRPAGWRSPPSVTSVSHR